MRVQASYPEDMLEVVQPQEALQRELVEAAGPTRRHAKALNVAVHLQERANKTLKNPVAN